MWSDPDGASYELYKGRSWPRLLIFHPTVALDADVDTWAVSPRGAGWLFGAKVTQEFSHLNGLSLIARAHQLVQEGYKHMFDEQLVTVWSAPK